AGPVRPTSVSEIVAMSFEAAVLARLTSFPRCCNPSAYSGRESIRDNRGGQQEDATATNVCARFGRGLPHHQNRSSPHLGQRKGLPEPLEQRRSQESEHRRDEPRVGLEHRQRVLLGGLEQVQLARDV